MFGCSPQLLASHPVVLALVVAVFLYATGDGVCSWLLGLRPSWRVDRLLLGAWSGLLVHLVLVPNLYLSGWVPSVESLVPWFPLVLLAASVTAWLWARERINPLPPAKQMSLLLIPPLLAFIVIVWPTLDGCDSGFYYSNNGEFAAYASLADFVTDHSMDDPLHWRLERQSREGVAAAFCSELATMFGVPPLLLIQPLAALLACLFFLSVGRLLASRLRNAGAGMPGYWLALALFSGFLLSASTQQVWSASFLSQYLSLALLGGFLLLVQVAEYSAASDRSQTLARGIAVGLFAGASLLVYPEMAPFGFLFAALFVIAREDRSAWKGRRALLLVVVAGAVVVLSCNHLLLEVLGMRIREIRSDSGWDLFGRKRHIAAVLSNILGFSNIFWGRVEPSPVPLLLASGLGAQTLVSSVHSFRAKGPRSSGFFAACYLAYLTTCGLLFLYVYGGHVATNYIAVKFATAYLWIPVLAVSVCVAEGANGKKGWVLAAMVAAIVGYQLTEGLAFVKGAASEAQRTRLREADSRICRQVIPDRKQVFLMTPPLENYRLEALFLLTGRMLPDQQGRLLDQDVFRFRGQPWIIMVRPLDGGGLHQDFLIAYQTVWERPAYSILRRRRP